MMNTGKLFTNQAVLESDMLILRPVTPEDIEEVFALYSNERIFEFCGILNHKNKATLLKAIGHFERDFRAQTRIKWGIARQADPARIVGIIEATGFNKPVNQVTVGYFLHPDFWHQGIASEALRILTAYLFEQGEFNRVQAEVMPANLHSKKVLLKNGYRLEGTLRQANLWPGKGLVDLEIYAILACDNPGTGSRE